MTASQGLLRADRLSLTYGGDFLFDGLSVTLNTGDKVGLVGPNGVGKSSLMRVLAWLQPPTSGVVVRGPGMQVGYSAQQAPDPEVTVEQYLLGGFAAVNAAERQMQHYEQTLATLNEGHDIKEALDAYGAAQERWLSLRGWARDARVAEVLDRMGVSGLRHDEQLGNLSGGQQARVVLAVLLLDEPTNHLDAAGTAWLRKYLRDYDGTLLVITHDRRFLDEVVSSIWEMDGIDAELKIYQGNYTTYRAERQRRWERLLLDWEAQEKGHIKLEEDIERTKEQARKVELSTHVDTTRRYAKKVARKAKSRERRLKRQMASASWLARPQTRRELSFRFPLIVEETDRVLIEVRGARVCHGDKVVFDNICLTVRNGDIIRCVGPNGEGKSTLLQVLAGLLSPTRGEVVTNGRVAYLPQVHDGLPLDMSVIDFFRAQVSVYEEDAERILEMFLFEADQLRRPLRSLSAGELRRLLLCRVVNEGADVILLDEPTNYLDFASLDVVEAALAEYSGTAVIVTHDDYFVQTLPIDRIFTVGGGVVELADTQAVTRNQEGKRA